MDYSDPNAFTLPYQLTKQVRRDVYPLLEPTQPELSAKGKTVLITGVSGGIGKVSMIYIRFAFCFSRNQCMQVIAESWATAGASGIVITGRNSDVLESVANRLQGLASSNTKILAKTANITDEASVTALFSAAKEKFGKIDVLINSAGSLQGGMVGPTDPRDFFSDFQVNVLGTYTVTQQFLAQADGAGTVVSFTTGAIAAVFPGMGGYTASKLALTRIMENLHAEQPNLRVYLLIPGIVDTAMTVDALKPYAKDTPELSASWTLFLSTPRAEWLRGSVVSVNCKLPLVLSVSVIPLT